MEDESTGNSHHIINNITRTFDYINNNNCHNINDNNNNNNNWSNTNNLKNVSIEIFEDLDPNFCQVFGQDLTNNPLGSDFHKTGNDNPGFKLQICKSLCVLERNLYTGSDVDIETGCEESRLKGHVCYCSGCGMGPEYLQFVKNTNL